MPEWISVDEYLPEDRQLVDVIGVPSGQDEEVILVGMQYFSSVGLISNITHWKPHAS